MSADDDAPTDDADDDAPTCLALLTDPALTFLGAGIGMWTRVVIARGSWAGEAEADEDALARADGDDEDDEDALARLRF
jgi:hypothetical protein